MRTCTGCFHCLAALIYICPYVFRVKVFIQYGWADRLVDPDASTTSDEGYGASETDDWMDIKEFYKSPDDLPMLKLLAIL